MQQLIIKYGHKDWYYLIWILLCPISHRGNSGFFCLQQNNNKIFADIGGYYVR